MEEEFKILKLKTYVPNCFKSLGVGGINALMSLVSDLVFELIGTWLGLLGMGALLLGSGLDNIKFGFGFV